jgi:hypothetical protein
MNQLIPDLLRSIVSSIMNILLLFSLARPKYNKRITNIAMIIVILVDVLSSLSFYRSGNLTALANYNILWFVLTFLAIKPLFLDSLMQWLFNLITVINVYAAIVILSFHMCYYLPYPPYAVTLVRFILFVVVILLFQRWLRPLYWQALAHWKVFILLVVGLLVNFIYYFMFSRDIKETMTVQFVPLLLLIILEISAYICIFYSLKTISAEYALKEENLKIQAREELLKTELSTYDEFLDFSRHYRHDLRHHNAVIREMLSTGDISEALIYLNEFDDSIVETALKQYCNNSVANAIFRLYENRAQANHIDFVVNANISEALPLTAPEIGGLFSNLLENAWVACQGYVETGRFITIAADTTETQFFLEIKNSVKDEVSFTDNLPVSTKRGGGTGSKSILRIVREHSGMCRFKQEGDVFMVQIVLSLR